MFPRSLIGRALAVSWLSLAIALLVFAYVQRDIHDMPIAFFWLLIFLTLPAGLVIVLAWSFLAQVLPVLSAGIWDLTLVWSIAVLAGYVQWFIALPWVYRRARTPSSQMRVIVMAITFFASFAWGLNDLSNNHLMRFGIRISIACSIAAAVLFWASRSKNAIQEARDPRGT